MRIETGKISNGSMVMGKKAAFLLAYVLHAFASFLVAGGAATKASAAGVYIIDTDKHADSLTIAQAVNSNCALCRPVKYMDMTKSFAVGRQIVEELKSRQSAGEVDFLVTLGMPATRIIADEFRNTPIFYSLTNREARDPKNTAPFVDFALRPPLALQLEALRTMAPDIKNVGFLATRQELEPFKAEASEAAKKYGLQIKFYYVEHSYDVPTGLRTAIQEMDALLFIRDRVAVNADTINYILQLTLENQIPTMGYTGSLVRRGILSAVMPDSEKLGEALGKAIQAYLSTGVLPTGLNDPSLYQLHINTAAMKQTPSVKAQAPNGMKVVMR
ncbi:MAG: hypothetical protein HWE25_07300 [Alphaproteobacteria bacterium]|nr:hypothetical protein [Alphaproteobacteria bacterium]